VAAAAGGANKFIPSTYHHPPAATPEATGPGPADTWQGTGSGGPGKPTLTWWFDQQAIDAEAATDGWYALLTNLDATQTAPEILLRYKPRKPSNAGTATAAGQGPHQGARPRLCQLARDTVTTRPSRGDPNIGRARGDEDVSRSRPEFLTSAWGGLRSGATGYPRSGLPENVGTAWHGGVHDRQEAR
jgi:hypothetical protein